MPPPEVEPPPQPPPMSTTSLPTASARSVPARPKVRPPVLASDILRDELAPLAPARRAIRAWLGAFSAVFAAAAVLGLEGLAPRGIVTGSIATAAVAAVATVVPAKYETRAMLAGAAGLVPLVLGAVGTGPLAAIGFEGLARAIAGVVLAVTLPAALLFRARYRAFRAARTILSVALLASAPAIVLATVGALSDGPLLARVGDGVLLAAALTAFSGFMGPETTGACAHWAALILVVHAARITLNLPWGEALAANPLRAARHLVGPLGDLVSATLVAYAGFQILASVLARQARNVDVHQLAVPEELTRDRQDSLAP